MSEYVSKRIPQAIEWVRQPHTIEQGGSLEMIARELADEIERLQKYDAEKLAVQLSVLDELHEQNERLRLALKFELDIGMRRGEL